MASAAPSHLDTTAPEKEDSLFCGFLFTLRKRVSESPGDVPYSSLARVELNADFLATSQ